MPKQKNKMSGTTIEIADDGFSRTLTPYNKNQKYIKINLSDLKLRLQDFKKSSQNSSLLIPFASLLALWAPIFTSDFKGLFKLNPDSVRAAYVIFAVLLTLGAIKNLVKVIFFHLIKLGFINAEDWDPMIDKDYLIRHESDPNRLAEMMCEEESD